MNIARERTERTAAVTAVPVTNAPANFASDNTAPVAPEIMEAIVAANAGVAAAYGADDLSAGLSARFSELFETEVSVFPVATGTAANVLALSMLTPPCSAIYCHENAHIEEDECGAPEFYTGAKLATLPGEHGRLSAADLSERLEGLAFGFEHHVRPAAISLSQATESGTSYRPDDVAAIAETARRFGLGLHMDGARFANSVAYLDCAPADVTWRAGVDALSFGATKNGGMAAEAVVFFRPELVETFKYRRKRGGHLFSKMRYVSAQLAAYVTDGLWLRYAGHANAMARRLSEGLSAVPGIEIMHPVEANEVFPRAPEPVVAGLSDLGFGFHRWGGGASPVLRLVTAFNTTKDEVDAFVAAAARLAAEA